MTTSPKPNMTDKQRIEFAKQIEYMYDASLPSWRRVLTFTFLRGIATGFGVFLGGTIVVALMLWLLTGLSKLPFLNDITHNVQHTLEQK